MTILLKLRNVFGIERKYPANKLAEQICDLLGTSTLTNRHVQSLKEMGIEVIEV